MMKVLCVFGTRPEAIKMASVIKGLGQREGVSCRVCVTAQHREMLDQVLRLFQINPDYDLNIMRENQSLSYVTTTALTEVDHIIQVERPDWVLVQGDTTTTMAASLAAFYHRVKVGHVEAGLRTRDKYHPFPEEMNRRIADVMADLHFVPTEAAKQNLLQESFPEESIRVTGNTVIDALLDIAGREFDPRETPLADLPFDGKKIILVTAHRREHFGEPLANICSALLEIAERYQDEVHIVYSVHRNPHVHSLVHALIDGKPNISLLPPLDYHPFVYLMMRSYLILTDSGGVQEEAPSLGKPVLVMREKTERPEALETGTARLVGTHPRAIVSEVSWLLDDIKAYQEIAHTANPFGDGRASERIIAALLNYQA